MSSLSTPSITCMAPERICQNTPEMRASAKPACVCKVRAPCTSRTKLDYWSSLPLDRSPASATWLTLVSPIHLLTHQTLLLDV